MIDDVCGGMQSMNNTPEDFHYDDNGGIIEHLEQGASHRVIATKSTAPYTTFSTVEQLMLQSHERAFYENNDPSAGPGLSLIKLRVAPTNRCTARCGYCPRKQAQADGSGYMDYDRFVKLVDHAVDLDIRKIGFGGWGEPTLHPRLFDMIDYAFARNMQVSITSNLLKLDAAGVEKLASYHFEDVELSMDGFTPEEYRAGKRVDRYETAFHNLNKFFEIQRRIKPDTLFNVHFVDVGHVTLANKFRFVRYWKKQMRGLNHSNMFIYRHLNCGGLSQDYDASKTLSGKILGSVKLRKPCFLLGAFAINYDGAAFTCSAHPMPYMKIGNAFETPLDELAQSPLFLQYREAHRTGNFDMPGCRDCDINVSVPLVSFVQKIFYKMCSLM